MEKEGKAIRYYGGIRYLDSNIIKYDFQTDKSKNVEEKIAIAQEAVKYVEDGDIIFCDSGSTVFCFCMELAKKIEKEKINVVIYTNSRKNLEILFPVTEVHVFGGKYRHKREDFCGFLTTEGMSSVCFDKCFVGADACVKGMYFATTDVDTMSINRLAVKNSQSAFVLIDSSKFYRDANIIFSTTKEIYCVITDSRIGKDMKDFLIKQKTKLICVDLKDIGQN